MKVTKTGYGTFKVETEAAIYRIEQYGPHWWAVDKQDEETGKLIFIRKASSQESALDLIKWVERRS